MSAFREKLYGPEFCFSLSDKNKRQGIRVNTLINTVIHYALNYINSIDCFHEEVTFKGLISK